MKPTKTVSRVILAMVLLVSIPSLAQESEASQQLGISQPAPPPTSPIGYDNATVEYHSNGYMPVNQDHANANDGRLDMKSYRPSQLGFSSSRTSVFSENDHAAFTVGAQTQAADSAISYWEASKQTQVDSDTTGWIQALSWVAKRRINAVFAYSVQVDKSSGFDSALTYRLHPDADFSGAHLVASLKYSLKF